MKIAVLLIALFAMTLPAQCGVTKQPFGKTAKGTPVDLFILKGDKLEVSIMTYGGVVVRLQAADREGKSKDVVLGFDTLDGYLKSGNSPHFGSLIGRYANRIAHGTFTLKGKTYHIPKNDGDNALHGGTVGFDKYVWKAKQLSNGVELTHISPDGDQGFPGKLTAVVRYILEGNELRIEYSATTTKPTVLNLTNHSYFNLAGEGAGDVLKHQLTLDATRYTPVDANLIPTGELAAVAGTPFDFTQAHAIGERIHDNNEQLKLGMGYDHNFVVNGGGGKLVHAATVYEPTSGRVLDVLTDQPGVQLYTANHLDGSIKGKGGRAYQKNDAFCLETQHFPDSPNHPAFPSTELDPGQTFHSVTVLRFSAK